MGACCSRKDSIFYKTTGDTGSPENYIVLNPYTESLIVELDKNTNKRRYVSSHKGSGEVTIYSVL